MIKITPIPTIKIINYISIHQLTYLYKNFIEKALNSLSHSAATFVMGTVAKFDESKAGASLQLESVSWSRFLQMVCSTGM